MSKKEVFHFRQFSINHSKASMKVGTDAVLLGCWTRVGDAKRLLDIGTGSGVIALMLAQRSSPASVIDAVEISGTDAEIAKGNVLGSPWPEKVRVICSPIQSFKSPDRYDVIVTNPPFFIDSLRPPDPSRDRARHTGTLSHNELLLAAEDLLAPHGTFNIVLPTVEGEAFAEEARKVKLFLSRKWAFRARDGKPVERWLLEFSKETRSLERGNLVLYKGGESWSDDYMLLTRDFYQDRKNKGATKLFP